jgi:hypothetical protein
MIKKKKKQKIKRVINDKKSKEEKRMKIKE